MAWFSSLLIDTVIGETRRNWPTLHKAKADHVICNHLKQHTDHEDLFRQKIHFLEFLSQVELLIKVQAEYYANPERSENCQDSFNGGHHSRGDFGVMFLGCHEVLEIFEFVPGA